MRLLLIGAPGSGKGTQADLLAERFGIAHISSGDLLRQHVREQTSFGQLVKKYVDKGDLVPDSLVMDILRKPVCGRDERLRAGRLPAHRGPRPRPPTPWCTRSAPRCRPRSTSTSRTPSWSGGCWPAAAARTTRPRSSSTGSRSTTR